MKPKLTRAEFDAKMRAEAELLIREGRVPALDEVLRAIEESRQKYRQRIADARKRTETSIDSRR